MKIKHKALATAALLAAVCPSGFAGDRAGYNATTVPAGSDALLTAPFSQMSEGEFTVDAIAGSVMTVAGPMTADAFAGTHYVRVIGGNGEGLWSTITTNTATTLTLENAAVAAEVLVGDAVRICKHHTLDSLFPASKKGLFFEDGTNILIYGNDLTAMGQNKSAALTAIYVNDETGWFGAGVSGATIIPPETCFVLRNNGVEDLVMVTYGDVPDFSVSMLLAADGDLSVGTGYPVPVPLATSDLGKDNRTVLLYDNATTGQNKSASKTAVYVDDETGWFGDAAGESIAPSAGFVLRLPAGEAETKVTVKKPY